MELSRLINRLKVIQVVGDVSRTRISGIYYDSRRVIDSSVFVAIKGYKTDGHKYIQEAISRGASVIVIEDDSAIADDAITRQNAVKVLVRDSREALADLSNYFFNQPTKKINLIGVTGTNGKTTTTFYLKSIYETAGYKTGLIGTISNYIGEEQITTTLTTPEASDLNWLFNEMRLQGCKYAIMEVSSHSLVLKRVHSLSYSFALFTNLTHDHLDFHGSIDDYFSAKKILFDNLDTSAVAFYNSDDSFGNRIIADSKAKSFSYGTSENSDYKISAINYDLNGTRFSVRYQNQEFNISTRLVGDFNAYNACGALCAATISGIKPEIIIEGIKNTKQVPGRFEVIGAGSKKAIVDYAHTPDSLSKSLSALRKIVKQDRPVYVVFGCGGNRDKSKRPIMGKIASEFADNVFITSDNSRWEEPKVIIDEIVSGISKKNFTVIENREEAIYTAINSSGENAAILIAGKGHENYQEVNGVRTIFSDKEIAEKYLEK